MNAWHWLVEQGLYKDLVATVIGLGGAHLVAWRPLRRHRELQEQIADRLDTDTPGGLGTVHKELLHVKSQLARGTGRSAHVPNVSPMQGKGRP